MAHCYSLTFIRIPNSVTSIRDSAFLRCDSLTSISIPDSITSIGYGAFSACKSLKSIITTANPSYSTVSGVLYNKDRTLLHSYPAGKGLLNEAFTIPDSVTSIRERAFSGCRSLTSITIPDRVTSIGDSTFVDCASLTSITVPDSVTSIGATAFGFCRSLTSIVFHGDAPAINPSVFSKVPRNATVSVLPNATGFGQTFGGLPVIIQSTQPPTITNVWIDAEGNFILNLDRSNTGIKLMYSPDLRSGFTEVSKIETQGDHEILIRSTKTELQGNQGFFRLSN